MTAKIDGTNGVIQAYDYQVLTTGFTYTFAAGTQVLVINPAGTLATGTVTMPAAPVDGMNITISSTQQITALTINGNTGQSIVGNTTALKAGGAQTFIYRLSNTTWYNQNNNASIPSSGLPGAQGQAFTSSGTFTIPASVTAIKVTVVGGGGGGVTGDTCYNGFHGGGGGTAIKFFTGLTPANTLTVTVGTGGGVSSAGGTSSVASGTQTITTVQATGGGGGSGTGGSGSMGAGGTGSGGTLNFSGGAGSGAYSDGAGGSSLFSPTAPIYRAAYLSAGPAGLLYGGGGHGGGVNGGGGSGAAGMVLIEW
jgi:hypothetical protein